MIERELFDEIKPWLNEEKVILIKGARQVGKTTLLNHIQKYLEGRGGFVAYFAVDQEIGHPIFQSAKHLVSFVDKQLIRPETGHVTLLIDEFQYLPDAGLFLKQVFDIVPAKQIRVF